MRRESLVGFALRFAATAAFLFGAGLVTGIGIHDYRALATAWHQVRSIGANGWSAISSAVLAVLTLGALLYAVRGVRISERALRAETTPLLKADTEDQGYAPSGYQVGAIHHTLSHSAVLVRPRLMRVPTQVYATLRLRNVGKGIAEIKHAKVLSEDLAKSAPWVMVEDFAYLVAAGDSSRTRFTFTDDASDPWLVAAVRRRDSLWLELSYTDAAGQQPVVSRFHIRELEHPPAGVDDNYRIAGQAFRRVSGLSAWE